MVPMLPKIELYMHTESDWVTPELLEAYSAALNKLLPELLRAPRGPEHVLSELECVEISIVDDETIAHVHAEFLDDPTATDVITFPYGEILVSCDTAARYAAAHSLPPHVELFRYIVHGLTHLHGYLDATPEQRDELFAIQEKLVEQFVI